MGFAFESAWLKTSSGALPPFFEIDSNAPYTMRSATDFFPWLISTLTNFATSPLEYFGSGRISRLGISLRRGINYSVSGESENLLSPGSCLPTNPRQSRRIRRRKINQHQAAFGFLAPYFERLCLRSFTPAVSRAPRTM